MSRKLAWPSIVIFVLAEAALLFSLNAPSQMYFDESHYVNAAKQIWDFVPNKNIEHPPLAKALIGLGILVLGDNAFGWRVMSTVFGALTLVGIFLLSYQFLGSRRWASLAVLLTALTNVFFIESRVAVIDPFMTGFLIFALYGVACALPERANRGWLVFAGACFGLAAACKWSALPVYGVCLIYLLCFNSKPIWRLVLGMVFVPLVFYCLGFLPYFFVRAPGYFLSDIWQMQTNIWTAQMLTPGTTPYRSPWYEWPLMLKPYWYLFSPDVDGGWVRGILFIGNPVIMYAGLPALAWIASRRSRVLGLLPLVFLTLLLLPWVLIGREATFIYYYYPAMLLFAPAVCWCLMQIKNPGARKICTGIFVGLALFVALVLLPLAAYLAIPMHLFQIAAQILPPIYIWKMN